LFFFFSSRRRHTRSYGDWSSDVCSSDLTSGAAAPAPASSPPSPPPGYQQTVHRRRSERCAPRPQFGSRGDTAGSPSARCRSAAEIGRASCRERVEGGGGAAAGQEET